MIQIEIDNGSGFCFGVTTAIRKAEEELAQGALYCLGDIVHNGMECERLRQIPSTTTNCASSTMPRYYCVHTANRLPLMNWPDRTTLRLSMQLALWCCNSRNASSRSMELTANSH